MPIKKCECCGVEFSARLSVIRTCGTACRNRLISAAKAEKHKRTKECVICQASFEIGGSDWDRLTCSKKCASKLTGSKTTKKISMSCATCGTGFLTRLSQKESVQGGGRYCSQKCRYERNKASTTRACLICGKCFSTPPSQMHVKTCSVACGYQVAHGVNAPHYKGITHRVIVDGREVTRLTRKGAAKHYTRRRDAHRRAEVPWADLDKIAAIYAEAARLTATTGIRHQVDHIVPLTSALVQGFHCESNLQILTATENGSKGNRTWPDMW